MDFIEMVGDTIAETGKEVADKAKKLAEIAKLKSRIRTCEEVIQYNFLEIGKMYYEHYRKGDEEGEKGSGEEAGQKSETASGVLYEKQCRAISNAKKGVQELQKQIREIKDTL